MTADSKTLVTTNQSTASVPQLTAVGNITATRTLSRDTFLVSFPSFSLFVHPSYCIISSLLIKENIQRKTGFHAIFVLPVEGGTTLRQAIIARPHFSLNLKFAVVFPVDGTPRTLLTTRANNVYTSWHLISALGV